MTMSRDWLTDQNEGIASRSAARSIKSTTPKQGVVPLMYNMIDTLEKFIELIKCPLISKIEKTGVERLRRTMGRSDVTTS